MRGQSRFLSRLPRSRARLPHDARSDDRIFPLDKNLPFFCLVVGRTMTMTFIYLVAGAAFPHLMQPGHPLWSILCVWVVSYHAGFAFESCGLPRALGMLLAGVTLENLPGARGLPPPLQLLDPTSSRLIRSCAMALVLVRSGLSLDVATVRSYGASFLAFATLPSLCEALVGAGLLVGLFDMPFLLALACSFLVAPVGPAISAAAGEEGYGAPPNRTLTHARLVVVAGNSAVKDSGAC